MQRRMFLQWMALLPGMGLIGRPRTPTQGLDTDTIYTDSDGTDPATLWQALRDRDATTGITYGA